MEIIFKVTLETDGYPREQLENVPTELRHAVEEYVMNWSPVPARVELVET
jgi:hypothetical protein